MADVAQAYQVNNNLHHKWRKELDAGTNYRAVKNKLIEIIVGILSTKKITARVEGIKSLLFATASALQGVPI